MCDIKRSFITIIDKVDLGSPLDQQGYRCDLPMQHSGEVLESLFFALTLALPTSSKSSCTPSCHNLLRNEELFPIYLGLVDINITSCRAVAQLRFLI